MTEPSVVAQFRSATRRLDPEARVARHVVTLLTPQQSRAVASRAHALEIRAGAGTGKTTTLVHRLARLARDGTPEHRLLAVTFTREATASLGRKLGALLGPRHLVRVTSFHAWAARELAPEGLRFLSQEDARRILARALGRGAAPPGLAAALGSGRDDVAARAQGFLSYVRNAETTVGDAILRQFPSLAPHESTLEAVQDAYERQKGDRLDYDDLLIRFRDKLARSSSFRAEVRGRIDHLAVDEYQDVNRAQAEAVRALTSGRGAIPVTVVGDPRQSIYGFRGASPRHLETFAESYGRRGSRIALTLNFRASRALVAASEAMLPSAHTLRARPRAPRGTAPTILGCDDAGEEARAVADHLDALIRDGAQPADCVVLARARTLAQAYQREVGERRDASRDVHVLTIHAAKGLEWDHVVILGAREGGLPSEHALRAEGSARSALLEEERRLLYVAMTRARKSLLVTWPRRGERRAFDASRFLVPLLGEKGMKKIAGVRLAPHAVA